MKILFIFYFFCAAFISLDAREYAVTMPLSGTNALTNHKVFDDDLCKLMVSSSVPGATVAIIKNAQLLVKRGYGYAHLEKQVWMQPEHALRIGSVSKTITAIALFHLLDSTKTPLDSSFTELLALDADAPYKKITLRHLLQMSSGWHEDRPEDYDIAFGPWSQDMLDKLQKKAPPDSQEALRYMLTVPLDFAPGSSYSYSNFSYNTLGLVIAKLANCPYEQYVQEQLFGCKNVHIGGTTEPSNHILEPKYYLFGEQEFRHHIERMIGGLPYGNGEILKKNASSGGWVATSESLVTLLNAFATKKIIQDLLLTEVLTPYYFDEEPKAYGFDEVFVHNGITYYLKTGSFSGTQAVVIMGQNGDAFAALFNAKRKSSRPDFLEKIKQLFTSAVSGF